MLFKEYLSVSHWGERMSITINNKPICDDMFNIMVLEDTEQCCLKLSPYLNRKVKHITMSYYHTCMVIKLI